MSANNITSPLTFGLDIGIASVGWAVLNETRVVDLGVRAFDKAETGLRNMFSECTYLG